MTPGLFAASLFLCAALGLPMLCAVLAGLLLFFLLGLRRGLPARRLFAAMMPGFRKSLLVVSVILLVGLMSATWRSSGLMALLLIHGLTLIYAQLFLLFVFLLCSAFSFILGSSLGAASVMGVMLFALGNAAGVDPLLSAGAILSGIYFGDRASYLSSSALLVATLSQVDHKIHLRNMRRSSLLPFLATALLYALLSFRFPFDASRAREVLALGEFFELGSLILWLPLVLVILPAFTPLKLRRAIVLSIVSALAIAILVQGVDPATAARDLAFGYSRPNDNPQLRLLFGGGLLSMASPLLIVFFSGALPPLLLELGVLAPYQDWLAGLATRAFPFVAAFASGILTSALGCSQTLAVFLQVPLLQRVYPDGDNEGMALAVGSTSILFSALVPWNVAMAAPLAILGASRRSGFFAFYLFLLPLARLIAERRRAQTLTIR